MFIAVRRASAIVVTIGLTPEQLGIPLASAPQTPVTSCSSPLGLATAVWWSLPSFALHIWCALKTGGIARADGNLVHVPDEGRTSCY
jgi:hypothetical protein